MWSALRQRLHERFVRWALRTRPPEPVPIRLTQRRVYVLPTRGGLLYGVSLLTLLIGAINYNLGLGYALTFLLAGLGLVATLHTFRNLVGLQISVAPPEPVFAGDTACFPLLLNNTDLRTRRLLRLFPAGQSATSTDLPARQISRVLLPLPAARRGWLELPRVTLETTWPLGLVRTWSYAAPALACLVYPRPADAVPPAPTFSSQPQGKTLGASGDEDFAGLRRHQAGDPPQRIAWKTAARQCETAPLQTKQFAGTADQRLWFDFDTLTGHDTETRLSILTRWILDADATGLAWGLRLPDAEFPLAQGPRHRQDCLRALALHGLAR